jgi:hypothetical protein
MIGCDPTTVRPVQTVVELWHNPRAVQAADGVGGVADDVGRRSVRTCFAPGSHLAETAQHQFDLANQPVER